MNRVSNFSRLVGIGAIVALTLAVAAPVAAADAQKLTAVVSVDSTDTPEAGKAWVRVLHASPDAPAVDIKVNDADVLTDVPFATISDYIPVDAGTYNIKVCAAGTTTCVIDADLTFADGSRTTVAATNLLADIEAQVIADAVTPDAGMAQVRVVHFSADTPTVDVLTQDGAAKVVEDLSYPDATGYLALAAGSYDLKVCATADNSVCPLDPGALDLAAGTAYSVFAIGSLDATLAAEATPPATDTVTGSESAPASTIPALVVLGIFAAAFIGGLRLVTARIRR